MTEPQSSKEGNPGSSPEEIVGEWLVDCRDAMVAVGLRFLRDEELANEMAQGACLVALECVRDEPGLVEEVTKPCPWLAGITANVVRRWLRDRSLHARILEANALEIGEDPFSSDDWVWKANRPSELVLDAAPDVLTPRQMAVVRAVLDGKTDEEIAAELKMRPATVRSHRSSAARRLRAVFSQGG